MHLWSLMHQSIKITEIVSLEGNRSLLVPLPLKPCKISEWWLWIHKRSGWIHRSRWWIQICFSPKSLLKWSNLTSIFFNWVGSTTNWGRSGWRCFLGFSTSICRVFSWRNSWCCWWRCLLTNSPSAWGLRRPAGGEIYPPKNKNTSPQKGPFQKGQDCLRLPTTIILCMLFLMCFCYFLFCFGGVHLVKILKNFWMMFNPKSDFSMLVPGLDMLMVDSISTFDTP